METKKYFLQIVSDVLNGRQVDKSIDIDYGKVLNLAILDAVFVGTYKYLQTGKNLDFNKYSSAIRGMVNSSDFQKNIETGKTHHSIPLKERIEIAIKKIQECNE